MSSPGIKTQAEFLGEEGSRFLTVQICPSTTPTAHIIFIPPFGEEMNRCRAIVAEQARFFASGGYACTIIDLFGTGDSEGELHQASFDLWHENIRLVLKAVAQKDKVPVILWGLRLGGLIALDFAEKSSIAIERIILWQPVTSGKRFVTQTLRQRVASLVGKDLPPETTKEIRQRLEGGENVEVSGYVIGGALMRDIESVDIPSFEKLTSVKIAWLENTTDPSQPISTASRKVVEKLESLGNTVEVHLFTDPPLWQLHKRDSAPELMAITGNLAL